MGPKPARVRRPQPGRVRGPQPGRVRRSQPGRVRRPQPGRVRRPQPCGGCGPHHGADAGDALQIPRYWLRLWVSALLKDFQGAVVERALVVLQRQDCLALPSPAPEHRWSARQILHFRGTFARLLLAPFKLGLNTADGVENVSQTETRLNIP